MKDPILIHSLFRSGSTYVWNKFREHDRYFCYYEPLHKLLLDIDSEGLNYYDKELAICVLKHPFIEAPYFEEYRKLLRKGTMVGVPYMKKLFISEDFCNNNKNHPLREYLDYLITHSEDKIPVMKFNRAPLRIKWFQHTYKDGLNIYLVRNPRDNWQSKVSHANRIDSFFYPWIYLERVKTRIWNVLKNLHERPLSIPIAMMIL